MFAKAAGRNPRRRQRTSSDDSVKPPKAKRQRSVLRQTDEPPSTSLDVGGGHVPAGPAAPSLSDDHDLFKEQAGQDSHLPIRSVKPSESPKNDFDGTVVLSSTDYYTVEQLPTLPDQVRTSQSGPLRCFFAPGCNHVLALTSSHAIIWPYSGSNSTPPPSETFVISIPEACSDNTGAVPLGVLLSTATGESPGLLVIIPSTGKVIYWESVSSASSLGLSRQKSNGIQGLTPGLLAGENATDVMNCEPSGVIVTFSSGRVAHVTLRDSQGRPTVLVNFLRTNVGAAGGLLGGLKNVLGVSSWRKEVIAARAGVSRQRGQRDVIIATSTGLVEVWDTHWNHGNGLKKKYDVKHDIAAAISHDSLKSAGEADLRVMDVAVCAAKPLDEPISRDSEESWRLFLVVSSAELIESKTSFVVQLLLSEEGTHVLSTHAVDLHSIPGAQGDLRPKLLISKSETTAFLLIAQSLVLLTLANTEETPTSQLLLDTHRLLLPFQDTIHLRTGGEYEILGYGLGDQSLDEKAACMLMVRNFGIIRVSVVPSYAAAGDIEERQLTAKRKIEQAVFYGTMTTNPLNLAGEGEFDFPTTDVENASLEICRELLRSESRFIPTTAISIDQNLRLRAKALEDLALLLLRKGFSLSRPARWELLWGAERLCAQRAVWKLEESLREKNDSFFLGYVIDSMNDKCKNRGDPAHGETDPVRQWLLRDSYQMEHIIPWIKNAIKPRRGNSSKQARKLSEQILGASELFLAIMETGFRYRDEHLSLYGLGDDFVEDGVLADGYEDLPEFWTSRALGYTEAGHLLDWELDSCRAWIQQNTSSADAPDGQVLKKIAQNSARHLRILGQMHRERTRWLNAQGDAKLADESASIERAHVKERKWQLFKLAGIGHLQDALSLAEQFRDMGALVELIIELQDQVKGQTNQDLRAETPSAGNSESDVNYRIAQYFDKFGEPWADAYFSRQISMGHPGALLSMRKFQHSVTRFLRKIPVYSKLSWINDVSGEDDYDNAAKCLESLAIGSEKELWSHRVEVSLAKLSILASSEKTLAVGGDASIFRDDVKRLDDYSEVDEVQDALFAHIKPVLEGAIDRKAEAELVLNYFGDHLAADRPSLHEILGDTLSSLVNRRVIGADGLIDLLTLLGDPQTPEYMDSDLRGREFFQALRVLDHSRYAQRDPTYLSALRKLIWRRCMIKDDWGARGMAADEKDGGFARPGGDTALLLTLNACLAEQPSDAKGQSLWRPLSPAEAVMDEFESDILVSRFRPEQRPRLAADLRRENDLLREYIDVGKLDFWFQELLSSVDSHASSVSTPRRETSGPHTDVPSVNSKSRLTWV